MLKPERTLQKLRNQEPVTIVNIGDYTSVVTHATHGRHNWFTYLNEALWETYGDGFITMINTAKCGTSFAEWEERLERYVLRFEPDLVIVSIGLNDAIQDAAAAEDSKNAARRITGRMRESGSEVLFRTFNPVVYGYWEPRPPDAVPGEAYDAAGRGEQIARDLVALANELDCPVVDHYSLWKAHHTPYKNEAANPQNLCMRMMDTAHPNAIGHLALFRELAPTFDVPLFFPWEEVPVALAQSPLK